jgi:hypothetical protein
MWALIRKSPSFDARLVSMALTVTLNSVQKDASGRVRFRFGDEEVEFQSLAAAADFARDQLTKRDVYAIAVGLVLTRQPALGNPSAFAGKSLTVDLTLANWGTVV